MSKLGDEMFSLGFADVIHRNYTSMVAFIHSLEGLCGEDVREQVRARLYTHESTQDLWKKWNLPVYFQLRCSEITSAVDEAMRAPLSSHEFTLLDASTHSDPLTSEAPHIVPSSSTSSTSSQPVGVDGRPLETESVHAFHIALAMCWRQDVYIHSLASRFYQLTLQILHRIRAYSDLIQISGPSTTANGDDEKGGDVYGMSLENVVMYCWDMERLSGWVCRDLAPFIQSRLSAPPDLPYMSPPQDAQPHTIPDTPTQPVIDQASTFHSSITRLWQGVCQSLASQCASQLQAVKGITATYRMTNKPPPTQPSTFVATIFAPLRDFDGAWGSRVPTSFAQDHRSPIHASPPLYLA